MCRGGGYVGVAPGPWIHTGSHGGSSQSLDLWKNPVCWRVSLDLLEGFLDLQEWSRDLLEECLDLWEGSLD